MLLRICEASKNVSTKTCFSSSFCHFAFTIFRSTSRGLTSSTGQSPNDNDATKIIIQGNFVPWKNIWRIWWHSNELWIREDKNSSSRFLRLLKVFKTEHEENIKAWKQPKLFVNIWKLKFSTELWEEKASIKPIENNQKFTQLKPFTTIRIDPNCVKTISKRRIQLFISLSFTLKILILLNASISFSSFSPFFSIKSVFLFFLNTQNPSNMNTQQN